MQLKNVHGYKLLKLTPVALSHGVGIIYRAVL